MEKLTGIINSFYGINIKENKKTKEYSNGRLIFVHFAHTYLNVNYFEICKFLNFSSQLIIKKNKEFMSSYLSDDQLRHEYDHLHIACDHLRSKKYLCVKMDNKNQKETILTVNQSNVKEVILFLNALDISYRVVDHPGKSEKETSLNKIIYKPKKTPKYTKTTKEKLYALENEGLEDDHKKMVDFYKGLGFKDLSAAVAHFGSGSAFREAFQKTSLTLV